VNNMSLMIPGHVSAWVDKCQQNIEKMQQNKIDPEVFRQQYVVLATIVKVAEGDAYFAGTQYVFPPIV